MDIPDVTIRAALEAYSAGGDARWTRLGDGLINDTFLVDLDGRRLVLQRLNPIFDPGIHANIDAVTRRLAERGLETPTLLHTRSGTLWTTLGDGSVWRAQSYVEGITRARVETARDAQAAGCLLARFHGALVDLPHAFVALRVSVHDLEAHLAALEAAVDRSAHHRLHDRVAPLAEALLATGRRLPPIDDLPRRPVHGDPKFSNVLFGPPDTAGERHARCLVDLDTVAPQALMVELGDAWRSWCNPDGEDGARARFDLERFEASVDGYREGRTLEPSPAERDSLVFGVERISLELAARFAADALVERYFGWDPTRFPGAGEHNLRRAERQWELHGAAVACRRERARILARL